MAKTAKTQKIVVMVTPQMFAALHALADLKHDGNVSQLARDLFVKAINQTQETKDV
jgi:hypothetical protein